MFIILSFSIMRIYYQKIIVWQNHIYTAIAPEIL